MWKTAHRHDISKDGDIDKVKQYMYGLMENVLSKSGQFNY